LYFYTIPGQQDTGVYEARSILAFDENNIWITSGSQITKWDGVRQTFRHSTPVYVNKLWGTDNNNIYAVGYNGQIARNNGTSWQRIESGTNANIVDISGILNEDGKYTKYCAADNLLLYIDGDNNLRSIAVEQGMFLNSVWAASNRLIYTAGNGIVLYKNESWQKINTPDINTIYRVKGQSYNDIVGLSSTLTVFHFNGYSWNSIQTGTNNIYLKIQIKNNSIATSGWNGDKALITLLFRN
ncbi:MAG: glucosyl transferase, partial [Ignavibacteria bacterium]|nr:glucosyl transferase [Ignavibacteria bacterium]